MSLETYVVGIGAVVTSTCTRHVHVCFRVENKKTSWLPSKKESNTWDGKMLKILEFL